MNVCTKCCANPSCRCWDKWNLWAAGGATWKVRGFPKSQGFVPCGPRMSAQNIMSVHPWVVEIFQSRPSSWTNKPAENIPKEKIIPVKKKRQEFLLAFKVRDRTKWTYKEHAGNKIKSFISGVPFCRYSGWYHSQQTGHILRQSRDICRNSEMFSILLKSWILWSLLDDVLKYQWEALTSEIWELAAKRQNIQNACGVKRKSNLKITKRTWVSWKKGGSLLFWVSVNVKLCTKHQLLKP